MQLLMMLSCPLLAVYCATPFDRGERLEAVRTPLRWVEAEVYCRLRNSVLFAPTTRREIEMTVQMASRFRWDAAWTGYRISYRKGSFFYDLEGNYLPFWSPLWSPFQPDHIYDFHKNEYEDCVGITYFYSGFSDYGFSDYPGFSDYGCSMRLPFICKSGDSNPTEPNTPQPTTMHEPTETPFLTTTPGYLEEVNQTTRKPSSTQSSTTMQGSTKTQNSDIDEPEYDGNELPVLPTTMHKPKETPFLTTTPEYLEEVNQTTRKPSSTQGSTTMQGSTKTQNSDIDEPEDDGNELPVLPTTMHKPTETPFLTTTSGSKMTQKPVTDFPNIGEVADFCSNLDYGLSGIVRNGYCYFTKFAVAFYQVKKDCLASSASPADPDEIYELLGIWSDHESGKIMTEDVWFGKSEESSRCHGDPGHYCFAHILYGEKSNQIEVVAAKRENIRGFRSRPVCKIPVAFLEEMNQTTRKPSSTQGSTTTQSSDIDEPEDDGNVLPVAMKMKWVDAVNYCKLRNSVIFAPATRSEVVRAMESAHKFEWDALWTGYSGSLKDYYFYDLERNVLPFWSPLWSPFQPDYNFNWNTNENDGCVGITKFYSGFSDYPCSKKLPFVCKELRTN